MEDVAKKSKKILKSAHPFTQTRRKFDEHQRLVSKIDEEGRETTYEHNEWAQVTAIKRPDGSKMTFEYDEAGRLIASTNPEQGVHQWIYHEDGTLQKSINENQVPTLYGYNKKKLVETVTNAKGDVIKLDYDRDLNLAQVTLPDGSCSKWVYC